MRVIKVVIVLLCINIIMIEVLGTKDASPIHADICVRIILKIACIIKYIRCIL